MRTPLLLLALGLTACASAPPSGPATAKARAAAADTNPELARLGYQAVVRKGELVYCRNEVATGSIMVRRFCRPEADALQMQLSDAERRMLTTSGSGGFDRATR